MVRYPELPRHIECGAIDAGLATRPQFANQHIALEHFCVILPRQGGCGKIQNATRDRACSG